MHPHDRLKRELVGDRMKRTREVVERLLGRDVALRKEREMLGQSVKTRSLQVRFRRVWLTAGPNAPLLKRVVKYPYPMHVDRRMARTKFQLGLDNLPSRVPLERAMKVGQDSRGRLIQGNPFKGLDVRPMVRTRPPSVNEWLTVRGTE
jgi:hypothetical protein